MLQDIRVRPQLQEITVRPQLQEITVHPQLQDIAVRPQLQDIAVAWGYESKAKGCVGSHIVCAEWRYVDDKKEWELVGAKMARVDGDKIKADVYYILKDGEFVEATK